MLGVSFNETQMLFDFNEHLRITMIKDAQKITETLRSQSEDGVFWQTQTNEVAGRLETIFGSSNPRVFLQEFGTGSKMDSSRENPYLKDYKSSQFFFKERSKKGNKILRRGEEQYQTYDYEDGSSEIVTKVGSNPKGQILEGKSPKGHPNLVITARVGQHILRRLLVRFKQQVLLDMRLYLRNLNWSKYMKGG